MWRCWLCNDDALGLLGCAVAAADAAATRGRRLRLRMALRPRQYRAATRRDDRASHRARPRIAGTVAGVGGPRGPVVELAEKAAGRYAESVPDQHPDRTARRAEELLRAA